jgi:hypothetical protein
MEDLTAWALILRTHALASAQAHKDILSVASPLLRDMLQAVATTSIPVGLTGHLEAGRQT